MTSSSTRPPNGDRAPAAGRQLGFLEDAFESARRSRFAVPVVVALGIMFLVISEVSHERALSYISQRDVLLEAGAQVDETVRQVLAAESGQRGYLLTGRQEYKEPYVRATRAVAAQLESLRALYARWPDRLADAARLDELARRRISELDTTVQLFEQARSGDATWRDLMQTDIGRETMVAIERQARAMEDVEHQRMETFQRQLTNTLMFSRIGIAAMVAFSLAALLLYSRQAARLDAERAAQVQERERERDRERQQLEHEVDRRTAELTQIANHLQTAREDERSRLARELHDELGGLLTAAKLDVARMRSRLLGAAPEVIERMTHLVKTLDEGIALKRRIIEDLRPSSLNNLGLKAALEILCAEFAARTEVKMQVEVEDMPLDDTGRLTVYRLVQEALTNVAKYASASRVRVSVRASAAGAEIEIDDDGVGFDPAAIRSNAHGLAGMRFRVRSERGHLEIRSQPDEGTTIRAVLPLLKRPPEDPGERRAA
jgi:signal transduction histidine kinase